MSPFRRILKSGQVKHPVGYSLLLLAVGMLVCMLTAVTISIEASNRAIREAERGQCESLQADVDAYREEPPVTKSGRNQLLSKERRIQALGCPKPKEG